MFTRIRRGRAASLSGAFALLLLVPQLAFAQAVDAQQTLVAAAVNLMLTLITAVHFVTWVVFAALNYVMNPRIIFQLNPDGTDGSLLNMLHDIWQFMRDLVNLGFALGLIAGAIIMIVTADGTKIKERLPKFVLAIILVNFSWFIPRVLFDVSQVLTYTVYQIPSLIGGDGCIIPATATEPSRPCDVVIRYKFFRQETQSIGDDGTNPADNPPTTGWKCPLRPLVCYQTVPITDADAQVGTSEKILSGLIVNHARLQTLARLPSTIAAVNPPGTPAGNINQLLQTAIQLVVILLLHIALLFPLIAMAAAFFIRIPVLWVSIAFMPLVALGFAFPILREGEGKPLFWEWQQHFLQAVFLPAKVAIPFTIGFIMLNAGSNLEEPTAFSNFPIPLFVGVGSLWRLIWMCIAIGIIWEYGFQQLGKEKAGLMGMFTEKIKNIGTSLGSVAVGSLTTLPILPVPSRTGVELMSAREVGRGLDPRGLKADQDRIGRIDLSPEGMRRRAGISALPNEAPVKILQAPANQTNVITIRNDITAALNQNNAQQLDKTLARFRNEFTQREFRNLSDRAIIENIATASNLPLTPEQRTQLEALLKTRPNQGN